MSPLIGLVILKSALKHIASIPHKTRSQVIKKAKDLILNPHPQGSKKLAGITTDDGEPIYRHRSGNHRILYIVRQNPGEVIVLDIDDRKDVYRMSTKNRSTIKKEDEYRMKEKDFNEIMGKALGTPNLPSKPVKKRRAAKKKTKS